MNGESTDWEFHWKDARALAFAVLGVCVGAFAIEGSVYEVLSYNAVPWQERPLAPVVMIAAVLLAALAILLARWLTPPALARAAWPLALAFPAAWLIWSYRSMGFLALYIMAGLLLTVGVRMVRLSDPDHHPRMSARVAWVVVGIVGACFVAYTFHYQNTMYRRLLLGYADVGWYLDRLHNTVTHGAFLRQFSAMPTFYDHLCPGLALLVPFYALWPSVYFLNFCQSLFLGGTGVLLFWLARRLKVAPEAALGIAVLYYLFPAASQMAYGYSYGFHPPTIALPFLIVSFYLFDRGRYALAVLPALVAVSMQEHIFIYYVGLGGMLFLQRRWKAGLITAGVAAACFLFIFVVFMPWHVEGQQNLHVGMLFGHLGESIGQIALSPLMRPGAFWGSIFEFHNIQLVIMLTLPLAALWMLAPRFAIALIPIVLFNLLRQDIQAKSFAFHYQTGTMGILFLAIVVGYSQRHEPPPEGRIPWVGALLGRLVEWQRRLKPSALLVGALICCIYLSCYLTLYPWSRRNLGILPEDDTIAAYEKAFQALRELIPEDATVIADDRTLMSLYDRRLAFGHESPFTYDTNYAVFLYGSWNEQPEVTARKQAALMEGGLFEVVYNQHYLVVLRRRGLLPPPPREVF